MEGDFPPSIVGYEYDNINNLTALVETINGTEHKTTYGYDDDNRVTSVSNGSASESYVYDAYSRVVRKVTKNGDSTVLIDMFFYCTPTASTTSGQVSMLMTGASGYGVSYVYTYDDNGNILSVESGGNTTSYVYDSANQLIRENNQAAGKTWVWTYDDAGNITQRQEHPYTTGTLGSDQNPVNYTYDGTWGDLLTGYGNYTIDYDAIGNPVSVKQGNTVIRSYTWEHGRKLASLTENGTTWSYTYNADGLRTKRTNGSTTYSYIYNGGSLSQMTVGNNTLYFAYDASGDPMSVTHNGATYYYATNLQGDVTAILNASGTAVVTYTYDAWGNILSVSDISGVNLGTLNPLRYRGYVYDTETGLYYVSSRYYDPEIGRFINADSLVSTGQGIISNNMFAYCLNNPVLYLDKSGKSASLPPMIENGLNLPASGGIPVVIDGTTYYYAIDIQNGQLYEYWFDADGNLIWGRHHTDHNKPWKHDDPHDHKGGKDKKGNNTLVDGPQPVDEKFHGPDQLAYQREIDLNAGHVVAGVAVGVAVYQIAKWAIATILAPPTGGGSYAFAALTP